MSMPTHLPPTYRESSSEQGGITIIVALMLLVLLTIAAISMSRNSFREIVISGTTRQGAMVRNIADSGIEFGILWMQPTTLRQAPSNSSASQLQSLATSLQAGQLYGIAYNLDGSVYSGPNTSTPPADLQVPSSSGNGFNLAMTAMGKMPMTNQSQSAGSASSGFTPASGNIALAAPDLWAIRSDGVYVAGGLMTFTHSKEAWISSPPR